MPPALDDLGPASQSFVSQRLRLHYLDWGNPDAPTLILLHGGRDHAHSWDWTARALRQDWHIVAPDLRGHGDSDWSPDGSYQMHDFLYDFAQLIETLGDKQVTIVAHSLGGSVATRYAGVFPEKVRKLAVVEGIGRLPKQMRSFANRTMSEIWRDWIEKRMAMTGRELRRYPSLEAALERMHSANPHLSAEQAHHLTVHGCRRNEDGSYSWKYDPYMRSMVPMLESDSQIDEILDGISCPLLLCQGTDSFLQESDLLAFSRSGRFADSRIAYYEQAGHWLHHDQFDKFIDDVKAFL